MFRHSISTCSFFPHSSFSFFSCCTNASLHCKSLICKCSHSLLNRHSNTSGCSSLELCTIPNEIRVRSCSCARASCCLRNLLKYFLVIPRQRWRCSLELAEVSRPCLYRYCYTARCYKYNTIYVYNIYYTPIYYDCTYTTTTTATTTTLRFFL